ncbi:hypothetical protein DL240_16455 [Lujinxingia litoralis]|uniref:Nucleotidyl transferase AbiEii/AbiGii toxin family protein n=1 Tax=Lujinxingia litoralis TaxID=2211119 RepID=A0A328C470_9DELT|nr:hypothetical protein [Lujinxingia litoralis]RAL20622.1 hypothetical protein DL240_16455 [Lujinxingia litoralis]
MTGPRSPRYERVLPSRSTEDLDLLLSAEVIIDPTQMKDLRDILKSLGFTAVVNYMQFEHELTVGGHRQTVKVDLLASPPHEDRLNDVKITAFRIRPKQTKKIHAYLTREAAGIHISPITLDVSSGLQSTAPAEVQIPSSLNYLVLKLHAFKDRHDISDTNPDGGRHHALDIFRIVTDMRQSDWKSAQHHTSTEKEMEYLQVAAYLQRRFFSNVSALGAVRIRENQSYQNERATFDTYLPLVLNDLDELFSDVENPAEDVFARWGLRQ